MAELAFWIAVALLVGGVALSVAPVGPGAVLSVAGLLAYWLLGDLEGIGLLPFLFLLGLAVVAMAFDLVASVVTAQASGTSTRTVLLGVLAGIVLTVPLGPIGLIVGIAGTVYLLQRRAGASSRESARAALYGTVGILASKVVQVLLNLLVLVGFLAFVAL